MWNTVERKKSSFLLHTITFSHLTPKVSIRWPPKDDPRVNLESIGMGRSKTRRV